MLRSLACKTRSFFSSAVVDKAYSLEIGYPNLSRYKRLPARFDSSQTHQFDAPKICFSKIYYEACDILIQEIDDRFKPVHLMYL